MPINNNLIHFPDFIAGKETCTDQHYQTCIRRTNFTLAQDALMFLILKLMDTFQELYSIIDGSELLSQVF